MSMSKRNYLSVVITHLKIGAILAILHIFRNTPVMNDLFIRRNKGMGIFSWISFKMFGGMLFGPEPLLLFKAFIGSNISLGVVGEIKCIYVGSLQII